MALGDELSTYEWAKVWYARVGELTFMDCESGGWQWRKSRVWKPERAGHSVAGDVGCVCADAEFWGEGLPVAEDSSVGSRQECERGNVFRLGLLLFKNRLWNRRRIPCALKLPTGLRAAEKV